MTKMCHVIEAVHKNISDVFGERFSRGIRSRIHEHEALDPLGMFVCKSRCNVSAQGMTQQGRFLYSQIVQHSQDVFAVKINGIPGSG